jgi:hypothetical protein
MTILTNVLIEIKRIPAIRLGAIVASIPSNVSYSVNQDLKRKDEEFATNVIIMLTKVPDIALGKIVAVTDMNSKDYSVTRFCWPSK